MKRFLGLTMIMLALFGFANWTRPLSAADDKPGAKADAPYVHAVVFYLKKDAPKDAAQAIISDTTELLAKIPSVRSVKIGAPAEKATPKVAVTDYQLGLVVLFDNYDGLKTYLDHPLHLKFVEKHEKSFDKVLVYDFVNQAK